MYSLNEGLKRSLWRAAKIFAISGAISTITYVSGILPTEYAVIAPLLASFTAFLEKLERNYRENKD